MPLATITDADHGPATAAPPHRAAGVWSLNQFFVGGAREQVFASLIS